MYLANIQQSLSNPTWDVVLVLALLAVGFFYGLFRGSRRIAATIIYTYVAIVLSGVIPLEKIMRLLRFARNDGTGGLNDVAGGWEVKAGIFLLTFLLLAFLLGTKKSRGARASGGSWWQIFLLSFVQVGFLAHIILNFLPPEKIETLAPLTKNFFAAPNYHLWWIAGPILIIILLRRLERR